MDETASHADCLPTAKQAYDSHTLFLVVCRKSTWDAEPGLRQFSKGKLYHSVPVQKGNSQLVWYDESRPGVIIRNEQFYKHFTPRARLTRTKRGLEKLAEYDVLTPEIAFTLEVFRDHDNAQFLARISGHTPPLPQVMEPGEPYPVLRMLDSEELRHADQEQLMEQSKSRMTELGGDIVYLIELNRPLQSAAS